MTLITGSGRGLGRSFAVELARAGAPVALNARSLDEIEQTAAQVRAIGGRAILLPGDVTATGMAESLVRETESSLGPVDVLINNAGVAGPLGPAWEVDSDDWWRCQEVNLRGPMLLCRAVIPSMKARGRGRIINIASGAGTFGIPNFSAYVTSKCALIRFTEVLAAELDGSGITVLAIEPGTVRTAMVESVLNSEDGARYAPWLRAIFDAGHDLPTEAAATFVRQLAEGAADSLSGAFLINTRDHPQKLAARAQEIRENRLYRLHVRK